MLTRFALLSALHGAGINPFRAWRLDEGPIATPCPASTLRRAWHRWAPARPPEGPRFPVFLRNEAGHGKPLSGLLETADTLDASVAALVEGGASLSGLLCVEFCAAPLAPGIWAKFNTFRVGEAVSTDHAVVEDDWCVKEGTANLSTPEIFQWERDHVAANDYAPALAPVFGLANIEYGRADHATVDGRQVVYEINTNPFLAPLAKQRSPVRDEAIGIARARYAAALWQIDAAEGPAVALPLTDRAAAHRAMTAEHGVPWRP